VVESEDKILLRFIGRVGNNWKVSRSHGFQVII
jgi:hypothetical protein